MADQDAAPGTPASSPDSTAGGQANAPKTAKDKNCHFCGQAFTSSSLGRHLDLYIKPRNPKPPDGIHNVDEIRRMRGGVTRRQPRTGTRAAAAMAASAADEGSPETAANPRSSRAWSQPDDSQRTRHSDHNNRASTGGSGTTSSPENVVRDGSALAAPLQQTPQRSIDRTSVMNRHAWTATGVINDLPSYRAAATAAADDDGARTSQAQRLQEMRRDTGGNRVQRPDYEDQSVWRMQEQAEVGRAAELALREVLGSLEAARKKTDPARLFEDVDFFSLSFPGLCLELLPPPPTLFSASPFPAPYTWFLDPPGQKEFEAINRAMTEQIALVRRVDDTRFPDSALFRHHAHVSGAFEAWQASSENHHREAWKLEMTRAFVREREQRQTLKKDLQNAQQHIRHLEAGYERLSRCQLPRDYLLYPPNTLPIPQNVLHDLQTSDWKSGAAEANYDVDALINKWKAAARATSRAPKPSAASSSIQNQLTKTEPARPAGSELRTDYIMNGSVWAVGGPLPRGHDGIQVHYDTESGAGSTNAVSARSGATGKRGAGSVAGGGVMYQTPPQPGAVVDADADADADDDDDDKEAGTEVVNGGPSTAESDRARRDEYAVAQSALARFRPDGGEQPTPPSWQPEGFRGVSAEMNGNSKRTQAPTGVNGRSGGAKVAREV